MTRRRRHPDTPDLFTRLSDPVQPDDAHAAPSLPPPRPARPCGGCGFLLVIDLDRACPQCGAPAPR